MKKVSIIALLVVILVASLVPSSTSLAQDPANIEVWIAFDDYRLDWVNGVAAEFNEMFPQYNVTIVGGHSYETMFAEVSVAAEQGNLPAVVHFFDAGTQDAFDSGLFKPVTQAIGDRTEINGIPVNFDDILDVARGYYTFGGEFASLPWNTSSSIWFNNMSILNAAGIETPPATWDEVEAACEAIMALENAPEYCFSWPNHGWFFEQWLAQQNQTLVNNDNGRTERATEVTFNSDAGVAILEWLDDMYNKGYLYYSGAQGGDSWATVDQAYQTQQIAMAAYSSSDVTLYTNFGVENGFETVASFLPYNDDTGWTGNVLGGGTLWVANDLDPAVEDGALSFLLYMLTPEKIIEWVKLTGYIPTKSANEQLIAEGWFEENPNHSVAPDQLAQSTATPATAGALVGGLPAIRAEVTAAIDRVLLSDESPADALNAAAEEANIIIEEYNLLNVE